MSGSKAKTARRAAAAHADQSLAELYAQVPDTGCKGLCVDACGPLGMSERERRRLAAAGYDVPAVRSRADVARVAREVPTCPALTEGRCGAYEARPMLCRLYGATEGLRCEHGCEPPGGVLPAAEGRRLLLASLKAGAR